MWNKIQTKQKNTTTSQCILSYAPVSPKRVLEVLDYDENTKGRFQSKYQFILATIVVLSTFYFINVNVGASKATTVEVRETHLVRQRSSVDISFVFTSSSICPELRFPL